MDLVITRSIGGRSMQNRDGGIMADLTTIAEAVGTGALTAWGILATRKDKSQELLLSRVATLEDRMDDAQKEIAELRSEKLQLEAEKYQLKQQVYDMTAERERFLNNETEFRAVIADLNTRLTAKSTELLKVLERLEVLKVAIDRQAVKQSMLYQQKDGETTAMVTTELPPDPDAL